MSLGDRLKECRKKAKKTQLILSTELGLNRSTYAKYETGDNEPDNDTLQLLADYFNTTTDFLLGRSNDHTPPVEGDEPPLTPDEEKEWSLIQNELSKDDALFFHQFLKAPNKKKRQLIKYWEHILMDDDED